MKTWWEQKAWPWLKKYGPWIIAPLGLLLLLARAFGGRKTTVVSSELLGAAEVRDEADTELDRQKAKSTQELDEALALADEEHGEDVDVVVDKLLKQVDDLAKDPDKLNLHLLDVGKRLRKP